MKKLLLLGLISISTYSSAQILWVSDMKLAQSLAISENKFILIDFWATWCGPCVEMDKKMWGNEVINPVRDKFIGLKIDIDRNRQLAQKYGVTSIPNVIIIDPAENKLWSQVGFSSPAPYLSILEKLPENPISSELLTQEIKGLSDDLTWNMLGTEYQTLGKNTESLKFKHAFLNISDAYFKKVIKKGKNKEMIANSNVNLILNDAYQGKIKKALKQALKIEDPNNELLNFILAYCYKCNDNKEELKKYKTLVKNPDLLTQLD